MARNERQMLPAPNGFMSARDPSHLPQNQVLLLENFLPARNGVLQSFPQITNCVAPSFPMQSLGINVIAAALWRATTSPTGDFIILWDDANGVSKATFTYTPGLNAQYGSPTYQITNVTHLGQLPNATDNNSRIRYVQYSQDLIFTRAEGMAPYRVSTDDTVIGTPLKLFTCGLPTAAVINTVSIVNIGAGNLDAGAYGYQVIWTDEKGRQSSPSTPVTATITTANVTGNVQFTISTPNSPLGADNGIRGYQIFRSLKNQPAGPFFLASSGSTAPATNTVIIDNVLESALNLASQCPQAGVLDTPQNSTMVTAWKTRLVMDIVGQRNYVQISNLNAGTQWASTASAADPSDINYGTSIPLGGDGGDAVNGMCALGDVLGVWRQFTFWQVGGDDITSWVARPVHQIGCTSADSVVRCGNAILWMAEDGIYKLSFQDGFSLLKLTQGIDDQFRGLTYAKTQINGPVPGEFPIELDIETLKTIANAVWWEGRYILSLGPYQYIYDYWEEQEVGAPGMEWSRTTHMTQCMFVMRQTGRPDTLFYFPIKQYSLSNNPLVPNCLGLCGIITPLWQDISTNQWTSYVTQSQTRARIITHPPDGQGEAVMRERQKELAQLQFFGTSDWSGVVSPNMATATVQTQGGMSEVFPIVRYDGLYSDNTLLTQIQPTPGAIMGRVVYADVTFNALNLKITNILTEYIPKDGQ